MGGRGSGPYGNSGKRSKVAADECRSISVTRLHREGILEPGRETGWNWRNWRGQVTFSVGIQAADNSILLAYRLRGELVHYRVQLTRTACNYGGSRPWFICPAQDCGRRAGNLYLRGRYFLCRKCHDLSYSSCQATSDPYAEACHRVSCLKAKLKTSKTAPADPIPPKPKGMHFKTYWRIVDAIIREEEQMYGALAAAIGMVP